MVRPALALLLTALATAPPEPPSLDELLDRAGEYVVAYDRDASGVVLEESYRQSVGTGNQFATRLLLSDLVLVSVPGGAQIPLGEMGKTVFPRGRGLKTLIPAPSKGAVTVQYPREKEEVAPRARGVIALKEENCTSCMLCGRSCPGSVAEPQRRSAIGATVQGVRSPAGG